MKAATSTRYGPPDVLEVKDVEKPTPKDDEVLVKVHAASINAWDFDLLQGRRFFGFRGPHRAVLGADIAGRVEAVGGSPSVFQPGDEVFGDLCESGWGAFAEYVCAPEDALTRKPPSISFAEAAAVPQAAVMALKGLRECGKLQSGQKVLINGAGGGVGSFAVQIAKAFGAEVTGVDSAEKLDLLRSIGADHVIDFRQEDYTKSRQRFDLILDVQLVRSARACKRVLTPEGTLVIVGGSGRRVLGAVVTERLVSLGRRRRVVLLFHKPNRKLAFIGSLLEEGKIRPAIDRRFRLDDIAEAFRYFGEGHAKGKLVITMDGE